MPLKELNDPSHVVTISLGHFGNTRIHFWVWFIRYISFCNTKSFKLGGEYELSGRLNFEEETTDKKESAARHEYSLLRVSMHLERHAQYWILNVVFRLSILTGCTFGSFAVDQSAYHDRCSITLTLLLAQVTTFV